MPLVLVRRTFIKHSKGRVAACVRGVAPCSCRMLVQDLGELQQGFWCVAPCPNSPASHGLIVGRVDMEELAGKRAKKKRFLTLIASKCIMTNK